MTKATREQTKQAILVYLEQVPVYKWAAKAVGISKDTLEDWRRDDENFSAQCEAKIAEFVKRTIKKARPEFQLERLLKDDFAQRSELTGKDGKDLPTPILGGVTNVHQDNSNK